MSGTIDVNGNPRELNAEAIDGDIHITGSSPWIRAKSASGAVTFQGSTSDGAFSTVSGPIRIGGGAYERLKVETVTGEIGFAGRLDRSASRSRCWRGVKPLRRAKGGARERVLRRRAGERRGHHH